MRGVSTRSQTDDCVLRRKSPALALVASVGFAITKDSCATAEHALWLQLFVVSRANSRRIQHELLERAGRRGDAAARRVRPPGARDASAAFRVSCCLVDGHRFQGRILVLRRLRWVDGRRPADSVLRSRNLLSFASSEVSVPLGAPACYGEMKLQSSCHAQSGRRCPKSLAILLTGLSWQARRRR